MERNQIGILLRQPSPSQRQTAAAAATFISAVAVSELLAIRQPPFSWVQMQKLAYEIHCENAAVSPQEMPPTPTPICRRRILPAMLILRLAASTLPLVPFAFSLVTGIWQQVTIILQQSLQQRTPPPPPQKPPLKNADFASFRRK